MIGLWSGFSLNKVPRQARTVQLHGQSSGCQTKRSDHRDPSQSLVLLIFRTRWHNRQRFWLWIKYAVRLGGWKRERSAYEFAWKRSMKDVKPDPRWQGQCLSVVYTWRETALSVGMTSDSFRVGGANLAASPRFREERVTWSVTESTSLFNYRAQRGPWMTNTDWKRCHFSASAEFHPTC